MNPAILPCPPMPTSMRLPHERRTLPAAPAAPAVAAEPVRVAIDEPGCVDVTDGTLWITVEGRPDDHVLGRGQRLPARAGDVLWIGAWRAGTRGRWRWQPAAAGC